MDQDSAHSNPPPAPTRLDIGARSDVFLIRNFLTARECAAHIEASEARGYEEAAIATAAGQVVVKEVRNNDRILWDDAALAADWWARCRSFVPAAFGHWQAYAVNERFRFYRYGPGQTFKPHRDGAFRRSRGDESWLTLMVYLNSDYCGGRTRFWLVGENAETAIAPETGTALVFMHDRRHEGELVTVGVKYVLRTDVMYRKG